MTAGGRGCPPWCSLSVPSELGVGPTRSLVERALTHPDARHLTPPALLTPIFATRKNGRVALQRMDNVGIVVESLDAAILFFAGLGLELEGRAVIEGDWSGRVTGLRDQRVETAMMRTPDGHGRIELSRFSHAAYGRRSPERSGERTRLSPRHVRRGRPRRYARPAPLARRAARRRSRPVRRRVSPLLRARPRGHSDRGWQNASAEPAAARSASKPDANCCTPRAQSRGVRRSPGYSRRKARSSASPTSHVPRRELTGHRSQHPSGTSTLH